MMSTILIGVWIDRGTTFESLTLSIKVTTTPYYNSTRGTVLVFNPGFRQNVNLSHTVVESSANAFVSAWPPGGGGIQVSLPDLRPGGSQTVQLSGIPFASGLQIVQQNWATPVYYASYIGNLSVTLDGVITCSTPVGPVPCESYTLYYGQGNYGLDDFRGFSSIVNLAFFASVGLLLAGLILSLRERRLVRLIPFATLVVFAVSSFLYIYIDMSVFQSSVASVVPIWARAALLFSHAGYWHYLGNMEYFLPLSSCIELLSRKKENGFPFKLAYLVPLFIYLVTGYLLIGFGISTLIGVLAAGTWGYFYALHRAKVRGMTSGRIATLGILSGIGGVGVIIGQAFPLVFSIPFDTTFTYAESIAHLFPALLSGVACFYLWQRRFSALRLETVKGPEVRNAEAARPDSIGSRVMPEEREYHGWGLARIRPENAIPSF